jgi:hypothetical protein
MALQKAIKQNNGVVLNYHRIGDIRNVVHDKTYIDVISYVDEEEREKEQNQPKYSPYGQEVYKVQSNESVEYNDTLTITEAYNYLKTTDKYSGATDV